ncbi:MAG: cytochrome c biogenesis protein [Desulfobulbaceae bacterium]|jgi:cytochrome c-type biogenesis protein CcsB|nr:cytochrome c biogenesis protein [Desulfobulbaceae bacterium]
MERMIGSLFDGVLALAVLTALVYLIFFIRQNSGLRHVARMLMMLSGVAQLLYIFARFSHLAAAPLTNPHEAIVFFACAATWAYLTFRWRYKVRNFGAFVSALVALLLAAAATFSSTFTPTPAILKGLWLPVHAGLSLAAYSFFSLAFCGGLMYLLQERELKSKRFGYFFSRLPSLDALDQLNSHCLATGFILLTMGIVSGSLWLWQAYGSYWLWGEKEVCSLFIWLVYLAQLHQRFTVGWRGRRAALMAIFAFAIIALTLLFVVAPHGGTRIHGN